LSGLLLHREKRNEKIFCGLYANVIKLVISPVITRRARMKNIKWIVVVISLCIFMMGLLGGCTSVPHYYVDTYDELKDAFKKNTDIVFPDISRYKADGIGYIIHHVPGKSSKSQGYSIRWGGWGEDYASPMSETELRGFRVYCIELECLIEEREGEGKQQWSGDDTVLKPNMEVDGIAIEYKSDDIVIHEEDMEDYDFPVNTIIYRYKYAFDYHKFRYEISGETLLLPEEQTEKDAEQKSEKANDELLEVVRSIIGQGDENE